MKLACTIVAFTAAKIAFATPDPQTVARAKTSPWLWQKMHETNLLSSNQTTEFDGEALIYMNQQADLSKIDDTLPKNEKGALVHKMLIEVANSSQKDLRSWLTSKNVKFKSHWITNLIVVKGASPEILEEIAQRSDVLRLVGNPQFKAVPDSSSIQSLLAEPNAVGANVSRIGADKVWKDFNANGTGVVIAGQDTGVEWDHPALKTHYRGWNGTAVNHDFNWYDAIEEEVEGGSSCGYNLAAPCDDHDHGTHTLGSVVGDDNKGNQIGVAPGAQWIACRNMDNGLGRPSTYIACFEFFLAPWKIKGDRFKDGDPTKAPDVMNNSWGCPKSEGCEGGEFVDSLKALEKAGVLVVVSAGNSGPKCSTIMDGPAFNTAHVLSVGAMNHATNKIASFSSRGPSTFDNAIGPHLTAPGENIRSSVRGGKFASFGWSGTSMAGPHVVGVAALVISSKPALKGQVAKLRSILMSTSDNMTQADQTCGGVSGTSVPNNTWGFGVVNAVKAVQKAQSSF